MFSVSAGGLAIAKNTLAPQDKPAFDPRADAVRRAAPELDRVVNDQAGDEQREKRGQADEEEIQRIDAGCHRRRGIRK
jgi:hypothetical protein